VNFRTRKTPTPAHSRAPESTHTPLPPCATIAARTRPQPPRPPTPPPPPSTQPRPGLFRVPRPPASSERSATTLSASSFRLKSASPPAPGPTILGRPTSGRAAASLRCAPPLVHCPVGPEHRRPCPTGPRSLPLPGQVGADRMDEMFEAIQPQFDLDTEDPPTLEFE
jgi:hypothetical protein